MTCGVSKVYNVHEPLPYGVRASDNEIESKYLTTRNTLIAPLDNRVQGTPNEMVIPNQAVSKQSAAKIDLIQCLICII